MKLRLVLLVMALGVAPVQVGAAQGVARGPVGGAATLKVTFALKRQLVNRAAPNRLELSTPWGEASAGLSGSAHPDEQFADYFGQVRPVTLRVAVPQGTRPGRYPARLSGELFACDQVQKLCVRRELNLAVTVEVPAAGRKGVTASLRLDDAALAPPGSRWQP